MDRQNVIEQLKGPLSRAQMLKGAAIGLGAAALPGAAAASGPGVSFPFFPVTTGTYTTETLSTILTNLLTWEYLTETYLYSGYIAYNQPSKSPNAFAIAAIQAELAIKQYHIDFLSTLVPGTAPLTTSFTLPASLSTLTSRLSAGVKAVDVADQIEEVLATIDGMIYQTAAREFAELGQPTLVEYAYQIGGQYYEMRGILRITEAANGEAADLPPNTSAFEADRLLYTGQIIAGLKADGIIGGSGTPLVYPGRAAIMAAAAPVLSKITNTKPVTPS